MDSITPIKSSVAPGVKSSSMPGVKSSSMPSGMPGDMTGGLCTCAVIIIFLFILFKIIRQKKPDRRVEILLKPARDARLEGMQQGDHGSFVERDYAAMRGTDFYDFPNRLTTPMNDLSNYLREENAPQKNTRDSFLPSRATEYTTSFAGASIDTLSLRDRAVEKFAANIAIDPNVPSERIKYATPPNPVVANSAANSDEARADMGDGDEVAQLLESGQTFTFNIPYTDKEYKFGPIPKGLYGDVPIYVYNDFDDWRAKQFKQPVHQGIYLMNSKEYWKSSNMPWEAESWTLTDPAYKYPFYP